MILSSGENYTLSKLFAGNYRIVIPDMQRDYCWAFTKSEINGKSLVENFIIDLIKYIESGEELQMGLLYAYESPAEHVQLCDGQQRLTTLYLTLGLIYKALPEGAGALKSSIKELLVVPKHQMANFYEPRFQYAIRESTLSFLTDLVNEFFLNGNYDIDSLKIKDWYFKEYDEDPSIQNILEALLLINSKISVLSSLVEFSNLLLHKINFLYFDMGNRTYGEEQFVVLNTTGKPLTTTENIKPQLLGDLDDSQTRVEFDNKTELRFYSDMWEEWEHYFWQNKNNNHQSADKGLKEFFRWVFIIENSDPQKKLSSKQEDYSIAQKALSSFNFNLLDLNEFMPDLMITIQSYFKSIQKLVGNDKIKSTFLFQEKPLSQIQNLEFLGLLSYIHLTECEITNSHFIAYSRFLRSKAKQDNVSKATITIAIETILIPKKLKENNAVDIIEFHLYDNVISKTLLNTCDKFKFKIIKNNLDTRTEIEDAFWNAEGLKTSNGDIEYMFEVLNINLENEDYQLDLEQFNMLKDVVKNTFEKPNKLLIRALLTYGHYYVHHGHTVTLNANRFELGKDAKFFQSILNDEKTKEKKNILISFLSELLQSNTIPETLNSYLQEKVDSYHCSSNDIWDTTINSLIKERGHLDYMNKRLFCVSYDETKAYLLSSQKAKGKDTYRSIGI